MGRRGNRNAKAPIAKGKAHAAAQSKPGADAAVPPVQEPADDSKETAETNQPVGNQAAGAADSGTGTGVGAGDAENKGLTDGQEEGQDVQGAEGAAAQGGGDPDGQNAADRGADNASGQSAADHAGDAENSGDGGASEASVQAAGDFLADIEADHAASWRFDVAGLARAIAGGARLFADGGMVTEYQDIFTPEEAAIMANFVRANPDAPVPAMYIHLGLQKRYPRTEPNTADLFVLSLFHAACVAAFKFQADQAAEEAAKTPPAPAAGGWPGEQTMKPQDPAFAPTGFSPR